MELTVDVAMAMMRVTALRMGDAADELSRLDAVAGDGDHGVNMASAFADASERLVVAAPVSVADVFILVSRAFNEGAGGSAGALFGAYFAAIGQRLNVPGTPTLADFAEGLEAGARRVAELGRCALGDKTMLDALQPAADAARSTLEAGGELAAVLVASSVAADQGAKSTAGMVAKLGRARYSSSGAVGTGDPGASSVAVMFGAWEEAMGKETRT